VDSFSGIPVPPCYDVATPVFTLLVYSRHFGAEVIKIEPPAGGDPLRVWRELDVDGVSPWFRSLGRNKKSVSIDLKKSEGREYVVFRVYGAPPDHVSQAREANRCKERRCARELQTRK